MCPGGRCRVHGCRPAVRGNAVRNSPGNVRWRFADRPDSGRAIPPRPADGASDCEDVFAPESAVPPAALAPVPGPVCRFSLPRRVAVPRVRAGPVTRSTRRYAASVAEVATFFRGPVQGTRDRRGARMRPVQGRVRSSGTTVAGTGDRCGADPASRGSRAGSEGDGMTRTGEAGVAERIFALSDARDPRPAWPQPVWSS